jgi:hypothetical protein
VIQFNSLKCTLLDTPPTICVSLAPPFNDVVLFLLKRS